MNAPLVLMFLVLCVSAYLDCSVKNPPPAKSVCGERGYVHDPHYFEKLNNKAIQTSSLEDCLYLIILQPNVGRHQDRVGRGFSYNAENGLCSIYMGKLERQNYTLVADSPVQLFEKQCIECQTICPDPVGREMFLNNEFEYSNVSLYPWYANHKPEIVSPGYMSATAVRYPKRFFTRQNFDSCPGSRYAVSFNLKVDNLKPKSFTTFSFIGGDYEGFYYSEKITAEDNGVWRNVAVSNPGRAWNTLLSVYGRNTWTLDNLHAVVLPEYMPTRGPQFLKNGDLESGSLAPWKVEEPAKVRLISPGLNSRYAIQIRMKRSDGYRSITRKQSLPPDGCLSGASKTKDITLTFKEPVNLTAGRRYVYGMDYRYRLVPATVFYLALTIKSGFFVSSNEVVPPPSKSFEIADGWYHHEMLFTAPKGTNFKAVIDFSDSTIATVDNLFLREARDQ